MRWLQIIRVRVRISVLRVYIYITTSRYQGPIIISTNILPCSGLKTQHHTPRLHSLHQQLSKRSQQMSRDCYDNLLTRVGDRCVTLDWRLIYPCTYRHDLCSLLLMPVCFTLQILKPLSFHPLFEMLVCLSAFV